MLSARVKTFQGGSGGMLRPDIFIIGLSKMQFYAFSGSELVNRRSILRHSLKCSQKNEIFDVAIIIVGLQLFVFHMYY